MRYLSVATVRQKERRRAPRTVLNNAYVCVYSEKRQNSIDLVEKIYDISPLGIRFISFKPYSADSIIRFGLLLPNHDSFNINVSGKVLRCEKKDNDEYHIAVEFEENSYQQSQVKEYIEVVKSWNDRE